MRYFPLLFLLAATSAGAVESPPMRALDYFQGSWRCEGVFPASGRHIASRMRYAGDLQGAALVKHHEDMAPASYRALEAWGYDAKGGRYEAVALDNFGGTRRFASAGWQHDRLAWNSATEVVPAQRFVYVRLDGQHYRVDWEINRDGKGFAVGDTLTCTREG
ncbi:MAG TPA: hypothetical protein VGU65_04750 [Frateuria sp.]|uniref:hypothetical protein n=1 Tax=Frateuria sp. TaxID=2211372 RepID=UPI002DEEF18A|nr:hypothetical protein [Frateuria sp.]